MSAEDGRAALYEIPFGHPPLMDGYPLDRRERKVLDEVLADYRRRDAAERSAPAESRPARRRRFC